jgi:hypothetical protein
MPGLGPGIHDLFVQKGVDGRDKPGHDDRKYVFDSKTGLDHDA